VSVPAKLKDVPNSSELLSSDEMKNMIPAFRCNMIMSLLIRLRQRSEDYAVLTSYTDAVIFVVRQDYTSAWLQNPLQNLSDTRPNRGLRFQHCGT
jgi:Mrp family chromosome partitioning ATPase